jgi:hypothetical protein
MQLIEPMPIMHVETLFETELRLSKLLLDVGGCQYYDDDLDSCVETCHSFEPGWDPKEAEEVLRDAIGRAWGLR